MPDNPGADMALAAGIRKEMQKRIREEIAGAFRVLRIQLLLHADAGGSITAAELRQALDASARRMGIDAPLPKGNKESDDG